MSSRSAYYKRKAREENDLSLFDGEGNPLDDKGKALEELVEQQAVEDERALLRFDPGVSAFEFENADECGGLVEVIDYDGEDVEFHPGESNVAQDAEFLDWRYNIHDFSPSDIEMQLNALALDRDLFRGRAATQRQRADALSVINHALQRRLTALLREHPVKSRRDGYVESDPLERIPPHNQEAEIAVLGNYMVDCTKMIGWNQKYVQLMFYLPRHTLLHMAMLELEQQFDFTKLVSHLQRLGMAERFGGTDTIRTMYEHAKADPLSHQMIGEYLEIMERHYLERKAMVFAGQLIQEVTGGVYKKDEQEGGKDGTIRKEEKILSMPDFIRRRAQTFCELIPFRLRAQDDMDAIVETVDAQFKAVLARRGAPEISTGYESLDKVTHGVRGGRLVVVGARPKIGKTTFCANVAYNLAERGIGTIIFTYESTKEEVVQKLIARRGAINTENFEMFEKTEEEQAALLKTYEEAKAYVMRMPIWVNHERPDVDNVLGRVAELKLKYPRIKMVVIDGIQSFAGYAPYQNNKSDIYYELLKRFRAEIGEKYNLAVFVTSQLKGVVEKRKGKRPLSVDDFSDCKGLAEVADNALALYRPGFYWPESPDFKLSEGKDWVSVIPIALRVGDTRKAVRLGFDPATATFYQPEKGAYEPQKEADGRKDAPAQ